MDAPFIVIDVVPAFAVIVGVPSQVVAAFGGLAIRNCPEPIFAAGKLSLIVAEVISFADKFVRTIVIVEILFSGKGPAGENDFEDVRVLAFTLDETEFDADPLHVAPAL